jgi:hypothetical protein
MPRVSSIFSGGSHLRASDLSGPRDVRNVGWHEEYLYGKNEYVLELEGESRGLRLTATLARDIRAALDEDDTDDWIDRVITIYPAKMPIRENGTEKIVDTIRAMKSELDKPPVKTIGSPPDDDIPY